MNPSPRDSVRLKRGGFFRLRAQRFGGLAVALAEAVWTALAAVSVDA